MNWKNLFFFTLAVWIVHVPLSTAKLTKKTEVVKVRYPVSLDGPVSKSVPIIYFSCPKDALLKPGDQLTIYRTWAVEVPTNEIPDDGASQTEVKNNNSTNIGKDAKTSLKDGGSNTDNLKDGGVEADAINAKDGGAAEDNANTGDGGITADGTNTGSSEMKSAPPKPTHRELALPIATIQIEAVENKIIVAKLSKWHHNSY